MLIRGTCGYLALRHHKHAGRQATAIIDQQGAEEIDEYD
jgi:hypothetical protein